MARRYACSSVSRVLSKYASRAASRPATGPSWRRLRGRRRSAGIDEPRFDVEQVFGEDYLEFYGPWLTDERSDRETDVICRLLGLESGTTVLDVACGHGRIANRLAARGIRVTGIDITAHFLEAARRDARDRGVDVEYVQGDMRSLPWSEKFDAVLNWFTAFGYFDDADCRRTLAQFWRVLRPGGRALIDINNIWAVLRTWVADAVEERDGALMIDRRRIDPTTSRTITDRISIREGRANRAQFFVRMFTFTELRDWLRAAGFASVEAFGETGEPLTADHRRLIAVARR